MSEGAAATSPRSEIVLRGWLCGCLLFILASGVLTLVTGAAAPGLQWVQYAHLVVAVATTPLWIAYVAVHLAQTLRDPPRVARRVAIAVIAASAFVMTRARIGVEHNEQLNHVLTLFVVAILLRLAWTFPRVLRDRRSPWALGVLFFGLSVLTLLSGFFVIPGGSPGRAFYVLHLGSIPFTVAAGVAHVFSSRRSVGGRAFPWAAPLRRITMPVFVALGGSVGALAVAVQLSARLPEPDRRAISTTDQGFRDVSAEACDTCHQTVVLTWERSSHARAAANPVFTALLRRAIAGGHAAEARRCLGCHAPHAADPTRFAVDEVIASEGFQAGVHCVSCHRMAAPAGARDGAVDFVPFANERGTFLIERGGPFARWLRPQPYAQASTVESGLERHLTQWRVGPKRPVGCRPCHIQTLEPMTGGRLTDVLQNQYSSWESSPAAAAGRDCVDCHMRTVYGDDGYVLKDHRFAAASTYVGRVADGQDGENAAVASLEARWIPPRGSISLESAGVRVGDELAHEYGRPGANAPSPGEAVPLLEMKVDLVRAPSGDSLRVETWNAGAIGHAFPNGPTDLIQVWLRIRATDARDVVLVDQGSDGPEGATRLGHRLLDARGDVVKDHRLWEVTQVVDLGRVPADGRYTVDVPLSTAPSGAVDVDASWSYRRLDPARVRQLAGVTAEGLPIVTVGRFRGTAG